MQIFMVFSTNEESGSSSHRHRHEVIIRVFSASCQVTRQSVVKMAYL